jgi:O-antigen/teichoic acid export membrane protein
MQLLHFGSAIVPWSLSSFVLVFSDRYFLNYYTNTATVGIYSLAYKFAFLLSVLAYTPFETVWTAQRFEVAKQPDAPEVFSRVFLYVNVILGSIALVICLFIRDFLILMSAPPFRPAYRIVPLLLVAQVIFVWGAYWTTGIYVTGRTKVMASGAIFLVAITILLNFLLIPTFGAFGAASATTGAYAARFFWIYYFSEKYYPIGYRWMDIARLYAVLSAAVAVNVAYHPASMAGSVAYSTAILALALYAVFVIILSPDDRAGLGAMVNGLVARARPRQAA